MYELCADLKKDYDTDMSALLLGASSKLRKVFISVCMSVCTE